MKNKLLLAVSMSAILFANIAVAQMLTPQKAINKDLYRPKVSSNDKAIKPRVEAETATAKNSETEKIDIEAIVEEPSVPYEPTIEEKLQLRNDFNKNIQTIAVNSSPKERERLLEAATTLQKIMQRQRNLTNGEETEIEIADPKVDKFNRREFQKHIQKVFTPQIDKTFDLEDLPPQK